jgi:nucleoside-diphosphate-sugar epimerase
MSCRIFLAGATGVIGRRLVPLLLEAGHSVVGMARSAPKFGWFDGAELVAVDVFDADSVARAVCAAKPDVIIHQLTDLSGITDPASRGVARQRNARIRTEGTRNLVRAAQAANVSRVIAQSIAWVYAPGRTPHIETDPLDMAPDSPQAITTRGVVALEHAVLHSPPVAGTVLRYGQLYGPGTGSDKPDGSAPLHVDAAAFAALLAVEQGAAGIFNIAEPGGEVAIDKAVSVLRWSADMRLPNHLGR